jgi:predicted nucleotidyltransferase
VTNTVSINLRHAITVSVPNESPIIIQSFDDTQVYSTTNVLKSIEVNTNCAEKFLTFKERFSKVYVHGSVHRNNSKPLHMDIDTLLSSKKCLFFALIVQTECLCHWFKTSFFSHPSILQALGLRHGACPRSDLFRWFLL